MGSLYAALQRLLQFSRTSPWGGAGGAHGLAFARRSLEQLQRAQDQLHQEPLARAPQAQFLQMDHEQPQDHQDLDQHLDDHHQDHRDDQHDPQDPFW